MPQYTVPNSVSPSSVTIMGLLSLFTPLTITGTSDSLKFLINFFVLIIDSPAQLLSKHTDTNSITYIYDLDNDITDSNSVAGRHIVTLVSTVSDTSIKVRIPIMTAAKKCFMITKKNSIKKKGIEF